jgi:hypothetical protein
MAEVEVIYLWALQEYEKALGVEHTPTLNTANNLGNLYRNQGKMAEAEAMYLRARISVKPKSLANIVSIPMKRWAVFGTLSTRAQPARLAA